MAWSTRELAELAGTTVRAVRHYHEVGLLEEPRRRANGYKQYGVAHLLRTLRIKRLAELGFTLPQIAELGDADQHPREALRSLDTRLAQTLDRLQHARVEVRQILQQAAPTDLPTTLAATVEEAVRDLYNPAQLDVLRRFGLLLRSHPTPADDAVEVGRIDEDVDPEVVQVATVVDVGRVGPAQEPIARLTVPRRHRVHCPD